MYVFFIMLLKKKLAHILLIPSRNAIRRLMKTYFHRPIEILYFSTGEISEVFNITSKYFYIFSNTPPASRVAHITRDFGTWYSCSHLVPCTNTFRVSWCRILEFSDNSSFDILKKQNFASTITATRINHFEQVDKEKL